MSSLANQYSDRFVREAERFKMTSISRSYAYQLEKEGKFPRRTKLGNRSVVWLLSDLQAWMKQRVEGDSQNTAQSETTGQ